MEQMNAEKPDDVLSDLEAKHGSQQRVVMARRLEQLKIEQTARRLQMCDQMLTDAGVPEWVMNSENESVPANSTPARLRWYLARRKDVKPSEIDQTLQREMKKWLEIVASHND